MRAFLGGVRGGGTPTWVSLPKHRWPPDWSGKYKNPVVPMVLALYGHVDAGGYWEAHCEEHISSLGWEKQECWDSVFWHPQYRALLVVYVDDFKLACPKTLTDKIWKQLRQIEAR